MSEGSMTAVQVGVKREISKDGESSESPIQRSLQPTSPSPVGLRRPNGSAKTDGLRGRNSQCPLFR